MSIRAVVSLVSVLALAACGTVAPPPGPSGAMPAEEAWFLTPVDMSQCEPTYPPRVAQGVESGAGGFAPVVIAPSPVMVVEPAPPRSPLAGLFGGRSPSRPPVPAINTEAFPQFAEGGVRRTAEEPVSTFSADVDTAS
jgi:Ca-activated chloride channel family protein